METNIFKSSLRNRLFDFINFKQSQGYHYENQIGLIRRFDEFLIKKDYSYDVLTQEIIDDYTSSFVALRYSSKLSIFSIIKEFSIYLKMFEANSYLIYKNIFRQMPIKRSYIFTAEEIKSLLKYFKTNIKSDSLSSVSNYTISGLLAFTGMRISECLNLNIKDWDEKNKLLFIKRGKFGKDRLIPLSDSVNIKLQQFMQIRCKYSAIGNVQALFINNERKRVTYYSFKYHFKKFLNEYQINENKQWSRKPTIHSLRHTFAVNNILKFIKQEENINNILPYLSTYMGHISLSSTQVYLQSVKEMKEIGANKFYKIFKKNI